MKTLAEPDLKRLLQERIAEVDFDQARDDVRPFVRDPDSVDLWATGFFKALVDRVKVVSL